MVRSGFLIKKNPANAKLESISFSAEVHWVSFSRIMRASCYKARWQKTFTLFAARPSIFNCKMVGH